MLQIALVPHRRPAACACSCRLLPGPGAGQGIGRRRLTQQLTPCPATTASTSRLWCGLPAVLRAWLWIVLEPRNHRVGCWCRCRRRAGADRRPAALCSLQRHQEPGRRQHRQPRVDPALQAAAGYDFRSHEHTAAALFVAILVLASPIGGPALAPAARITPTFACPQPASNGSIDRHHDLVLGRRDPDHHRHRSVAAVRGDPVLRQGADSTSFCSVFEWSPQTALRADQVGSLGRLRRDPDSSPAPC